MRWYWSLAVVAATSLPFAMAYSTAHPAVVQDGAKASANDAEIKAGIEKIIADYDAAMKKYREDLAAARKENPRATLPLVKVTDYLEPMLKTIEKAPGSQATTAAYNWVLGRLPSLKDEQIRTLADNVLKHQLDNSGVADALSTLFMSAGTKAKDHPVSKLTEEAFKSKSTHMQGVAYYAQGQTKVTKLRTIERGLQMGRTVETAKKNLERIQANLEKEEDETKKKTLTAQKTQMENMVKSYEASYAAAKKDQDTMPDLKAAATKDMEKAMELLSSTKSPHIHRVKGFMNDSKGLLNVGKEAPEIVGEDIDGKAIKLSDYRGKVVLLDFWGHW